MPEQTWKWKDGWPPEDKLVIFWLQSGLYSAHPQSAVLFCCYLGLSITTALKCGTSLPSGPNAPDHAFPAPSRIV